MLFRQWNYVHRQSLAGFEQSSSVEQENDKCRRRRIIKLCRNETRIFHRSGWNGWKAARVSFPEVEKILNKLDGKSKEKESAWQREQTATHHHLSTNTSLRTRFFTTPECFSFFALHWSNFGLAVKKLPKGASTHTPSNARAHMKPPNFAEVREFPCKR